MPLPLNTVVLGDCLEVLRTLPDASVDAVVTDPPAGISFMGREWDADKGGRTAWVGWMTSVMQECLRVLKPGGHALVWSLPRTSHWTGAAIEDAGFEVRDCIHHIFGQGFPKSLNIGKAIDRMAGAERERVINPRWIDKYPNGPGGNKSGGDRAATINQLKSISGNPLEMTLPATPEAQAWDGWHTALKPAVETWWLARKPIEAANVAAQVLATGTGAINVDGTRVASDGSHFCSTVKGRTGGMVVGGDEREGAALGMFAPGKSFEPTNHPGGRWPSNLVLSHSPECEEQGEAYECATGCPVAALDRQSGVTKSAVGRPHTQKDNEANVNFNGRAISIPGVNQHGDSGGASRFFNVFEPDYTEPFLYTGKASKADKNEGLDDLPARAQHRIEEQTVSTQSNRRCRKCGYVKFGKPFCECEEPEWEETAGSKSGNFHPTVKSQALMRHLVRLVTPKGGIVLDPFAGSGSTLVAAVTEGMKFVGIEREPEYHAIAKARTDAVLEREGAAARQREAFNLMDELEQE